MNISILGCGWLGLPLAKHLIAEGNSVKGSVTSREKLQKLQTEGIVPYQIKIFPEGVQGHFTAFLKQAEILIIDIPPGLRSDPTADFLGKIGRIIDYLERSFVQKVLFVSSTTVYRDTKDFPEYTEEDHPNGTSEAAKQLISAENLLLKNEHFNTSVVRFAGLIGPGRHPVKFLAGRSGIKNPEAPVNLIHLQACIEIINRIINKNAWGEVFNAAAPEHPGKEIYYSAKAKEKNMLLPEFDKTNSSVGKIIKSTKLGPLLNYEFGEKI